MPQEGGLGSLFRQFPDGDASVVFVSSDTQSLHRNRGEIGVFPYREFDVETVLRQAVGGNEILRKGFHKFGWLCPGEGR